MNDVQISPSREVDLRRATQRERLIACAEVAIAAEGLAGLRARALAQCVGCSLGAIYNLVPDLDELTLLVGQRTLRDLGDRLDKSERGTPGSDQRFVAWALAYWTFAVDHRHRWRALFDYRLPPGRALPGWFAADQMRLFSRLEDGLATRMPTLEAATCRLRARTLFSAVHGIVALGLEEKIVAMPIGAVQNELENFVPACLRGMQSGA